VESQLLLEPPASGKQLPDALQRPLFIGVLQHSAFAALILNKLYKVVSDAELEVLVVRNAANASAATPSAP
jgi:hypothetical protein